MYSSGYQLSVECIQVGERGKDGEGRQTKWASVMRRKNNGGLVGWLVIVMAVGRETAATKA